MNDCSICKNYEPVTAKTLGQTQGGRGMTNGDRIRAMTDEKLAEECGFMFSCEQCEEITGGCEKCPHGAATYEYCIGRWLKWLKMEGEE